MKQSRQDVRFKLGCLGLFLSGLVFTSQAAAVDNVAPKQLLLEQILLGEVSYRDDLVKHSLERLELIAPNDPEVIAARLRLALRQGNQRLAQQQLEKLKQLVPDSDFYRNAKTNIRLSLPEGEHQLQLARVMVIAGRITEAKNQYDLLFHGEPPTPSLAVEYWTLVSKIPGQEQIALTKLQAVYFYLQQNKVIADNTNNWQSSLKKTLSRLSISVGDAALKVGNLALAEQQYQQAYQYDNNNELAFIGLGDVAFARQDFGAAEQAYKKAALLYPQGNLAAYRLVRIYKRQSPQKALNYLDSLSLSQQLEFKPLKLNLQTDIFQQQAAQFESHHQGAEALKKYLQAYQIEPNDPWLVYHLAKTMYQLGQREKANRIFSQLLVKQPNDLKIIYPYALYLSGTAQNQRALTYLNKLPKTLWTNDIRQLVQRLQTQLVAEQLQKALDYAQKLRVQGSKNEANAYLLKQAPLTRIRLKLADWALEDGKLNEALAYYREAKAAEPQNTDAQLGEIEVLVATQRFAEARKLLQIELRNDAALSINMLRRIANAWTAVGEPTTAYALVQRAKKLAKSQPPSESTALVFRDAARLEQQLYEPKLARTDYSQAMLHSKISPALPTDNDHYTWLTRNHSDDDWLKRSIRSEAGALYRQQELRATVEHDSWSLSGTQGVSNLDIKDTIIQADTPLYDGRIYYRGDLVDVSAGDFVTTSGVYVNDFGTCANGCSRGISQKAKGYNGAVGWQNNRWTINVGTTPLGFKVSNFVGGLSYSGDFHHVGWTLAAMQHATTNSLLSFAGTKDPNTGITWGGIVASGANLSLSYDRGGSFGLWANVSAEQMTGKNVASNQRVRLFDGYYYKLINEDNRRASIGLNSMLWHYQKDLSRYSLGQGGYYSPQKYLSFSLPVDYRQRTANWSYELGGSVSWATATTNNSWLYPLPNLIPAALQVQNTLISGSTSSGYGYTILALVERRLGSHFTGGAVINIQRTRDYTPSHISLYLRYSLDGWMGDLDMPIRPLLPYANFS